MTSESTDAARHLACAISSIAAARDRLSRYARDRDPLSRTRVDLAYVVAAAYLLDAAETALIEGEQ